MQRAMLRAGMRVVVRTKRYRAQENECGLICSVQAYAQLCLIRAFVYVSTQFVCYNPSNGLKKTQKTVFSLSQLLFDRICICPFSDFLCSGNRVRGYNGIVFKQNNRYPTRKILVYRDRRQPEYRDTRVY